MGWIQTQRLKGVEQSMYRRIYYCVITHRLALTMFLLFPFLAFFMGAVVL